MHITVIAPGRNEPRSFQTKFVLKKDYFNDYGFQTRYDLYREISPDGENRFLIGTVKILRRGQTAQDGLPVTDDIDGPLTDEYCSVGVSLDYYERLNTLDSDERDRLLATLRDVVSEPDLVGDFKDEPGWTTSLFRGNDKWETFLADAGTLYRGNYETLAGPEQRFSFYLRQSDEQIDFALGAPLPDFYGGPYRRTPLSKERYVLPERILVLVGRNGSGKSTILADLAHVAFATPEERSRKKTRRKGRLEPNGIGFFRIITISYSAFDSFTLPGLSDADFAQIATDVTKGEGRFIYCGLRDIAAEAKHDSDLAADGTAARQDDRRSTTMLKSVDQLADEFERLIINVQASERKVELLSAAMEALVADPSFTGLELEDALDPLKARRIFLGWSTGHKIVMHVVLSLVAHVSRNSLVLFDEPETHLHPPLTAALMHSVRLILTEVNACCVVSTHSPVVLQETLARHVRFVERKGDQVEIKSAVRETFGENVGLLTYEAFGLTAASTDFHEALDLLVRSNEDIEEIEKLFTNGLSSQARAYVLSELAAKDD